MDELKISYNQVKFLKFVLKLRNMESVILSSDSQKDLNLILQIAKKIGISIKKLSKEEIEEIGLSIAIKKGRTGEYIERNTYNP